MHVILMDGWSHLLLVCNVGTQLAYIQGPSDAQTTISCNKLVLAYQVVWVEHALSTTQDGVLASIIGMVLRWDLKYCWHWSRVTVNHMSDHLSDVLVDQDDVNVITLYKPSEAFFNFAHWGVFVNNHEVWVSVFVDLTNPTQQETNAGILVSNDADQFTLNCHAQSHV
ncbi:unnamed protein product [Spodoptera exigua]|nr:unnamed protein product [Spodoptera exigua]